MLIRLARLQFHPDPRQQHHLIEGAEPQDLRDGYNDVCLVGRSTALHRDGQFRRPRMYWYV